MGNYKKRDRKDSSAMNNFMKTKEEVDVDIRLEKALLIQILLGFIKIGSKFE